jgi:thiol-disulfide isomerase/thioredoxin
MKKFSAMFVILFFVLLSQFAAEADEFFPAFTSQTLSGETVTDDIFFGKRLTMVNIWATWCGPCISEMPELGRLAGMMPEGTQLVGIIEDALYDSTAVRKARNIVNLANANFTQIIAASSMNSYLYGIEAIPTTIFVDSEGKIVGQPLVGSRYAGDYLGEIESILGDGGSSRYAITPPVGLTGGRVTLSDTATTAVTGYLVEFEYVPDSGYELESLSAHRTGDTSVNVNLFCQGNTCDFVMPAYPVTIEASFRPASNGGEYAITASDSITGGMVTLNETAASIGESVTFTYASHSGYILNTISAHKTGDRNVNVPLSCRGYNCRFLMPGYPVTIEASFTSMNSGEEYAITVSDGITGGTVTLNETAASVGELVEFEYAPDSGYELETISAHRTGDTSVNVPLSCRSDT